MTSSTTGDAQQPVLFQTIRTASGQKFGHATLNSPASLHALSLPMVKLLDQQLEIWATDPEIVGVILDGAGEKAFCAGGDVVSLCHAIRENPKGKVPQLAYDFFSREYRLDYRIHTYNKPVICWAHGIVMGGGVGLMAGASHRVVTPKTRLAMPEITIGLYPDVGGSWILARLPGKIGPFLAMTGASINAADALYAGLADHALPVESRTAVIEAIQCAKWNGDKESDANQITQLLRKFSHETVLPDSKLCEHFERINQAVGDDGFMNACQRVMAFSSDPDPWLSTAGQTLSKGSPTSAALGLTMQERARDLSLAETFQLELQASMGCCVYPDFAEGVRALLVDKDKNPNWQPKTHGEVTTEWIAGHLVPRFEGSNPLIDLH